MKKAWLAYVVLGLLLVLIAGTALAQAAETGVGTDTSSAEQEAQQAEAVINQIPIDESGEFDPSKLTTFKTKAEQRIDAINAWLATNAAWLKVVFGMVPEISWLFAINLYMILWFMTLLVFNGKSLIPVVSKGASSLIGIILFIMGIILKLYLWIAAFELGIIILVWNYVIPGGMVIAIVLIIIICAAVYFIPLPILLKIEARLAKKREEREKKKEELNRQTLDVFVKEAFQKP